MTFGRPSSVLRLTPVAIATLSPRDAIAETLAEYLRAATFRVWGGESADDTDFQLTSVLSEWPDPDAALDYPCASIVEMTDTFHEAHNFVPTALEETLGLYDGACGNGPHDPSTVLWKLSEAKVRLQLDFWASSRAQRQAIEAELGALFSPNEGRSGVLLGGHPRYFDQPVRCTLASHRRVDTGTTAYANERRLQCAIDAEVDIVRLYRAVLTSMNLATDAIDGRFA